MTKKNDKIPLYIKVRDIGLLKAALLNYRDSIESRNGHQKVDHFLKVLEDLDNMTRFSYWKIQKRLESEKEEK